MNHPIDLRPQDTGASADADRAATPSEPSPSVSGKAGIPCALRSQLVADDPIYTKGVTGPRSRELAALITASADLIEELCSALVEHPEYAADTTFAAIWVWLGRKDDLIAKVRGEKVRP